MAFTSETARAAGSKKKPKIITKMLISKLLQNGGAKLEALCDNWIELALRGNPIAIKEIVSRVEGKIPQPIVGDEENPVIIEHARAREFIARRILGAAVESGSSEAHVRSDGSAVS